MDFCKSLVRIIQETIPLTQRETWFEWLKRQFSAPNHKEAMALEYLEKHKNAFWVEVSEAAQKISEEFSSDFQEVVNADLQVNVRSGLMDVAMGASGKSSSSSGIIKKTEQEVHRLGIEFVGRTLAGKISMLPEVIKSLMSEKKKYLYIFIDRLDESMMMDRFRFQSIRGLVDAATEINRQISNIKVVVSLRTDMVKNIFDKVDIPGFQYEKIKDLQLPLNWSEEDLIDLADMRISKLIQKKYEPRAKVSFSEIFPATVHVPSGGIEQTEKYLFSRTWLRPRDLIDFINQCLRFAENCACVTQEMIFSAEVEYSRGRMKSIHQEWIQAFPAVQHITESVKSLGSSFPVGNYNDEILEPLCHLILQDDSLPECEEKEIFLEYRRTVPTKSTRDFCLKMLYDIGVIGIKFQANESMRWSHTDRFHYSVSDLPDDSHVLVHKALWSYYNFSEKDD